MINNINIVGIVGVGLIGGSIALAIKKASPQTEIIAYDINPDSIKYAFDRKIIDESLTNPESINKAHLIILACPVKSIISWLSRFGTTLKKGTIILDVGSTKRLILSEMEKLPPDVYAMGGHLMAGSEKSGIEAADAALLDSSAFFIIPGKTSPDNIIEEVKQLIRKTGAVPYITDANTHDYILAATSHLPYLLSISLVNSLKDKIEIYPGIKKFMAGGFRDTSRLAACNTDMSFDMCTTNRDFLIKELKEYRNHFDEMISLLESKDDEKFRELLKKSKDSHNLLKNDF